jgi:hypothetical protein
MDEAPLGGPYKEMAGHMGAPPWSPHLSLDFSLGSLWKDFIHVHFGFSCKTTLPLGFPFK